jgi:hypothetical protein
MAIKISGNNVIDDARKFIPVTVEAQGVVGVGYSVFTSTGSGVQWRDLATILANVPANYVNYLTIDTTSANYGNLTQTYVSTSSNDTIDLSSTDLYGLFSSTGAATLSVNAAGNLVYTI